MIDLHQQLRSVLFPLGEFDRLREHQQRGAAIAREIGDELLVGVTLAGQAHYHAIIAGETREAIQYARQALEIGERTGHVTLAGRARNILGQALHGRGDHLGAISILERNLRFLDELVRAGKSPERWSLGMPLAVFGRTWLSFALAELGRFPEAVGAAERAVEEGEALAHLYSLYHAYWALGAAHLEQGDHARSLDLFHRVERIAREADLRAMIENAYGLLGYAHALASRLGEALSLLEGAAGRRNVFTGHRDILYLGDVYLRCGRLDDALETVKRGLGLAQELERRAREAWALRLLADVHAARGDRDQAEALYRNAIALGEELGLRPATAHAHRGLGRLNCLAGKRQEADEHLGAARAMYADMGMTYWLEKAEAEMTN
jgi:tetratricopeptide (TPR) repeat protein